LDHTSAQDAWIEGLAVLACLVLSFCFSGSETAITSLGEHRVQRLLEHRRGPTGFLQLWMNEPSRVLTALLVGNTIVNILASSLTTEIMLRLTNEGATAVAIGVLTMLILVVGEIAPKTLAKNRPEWFLPVFRLIYAFHLATWWLTRVLTWFAGVLVRLLGGTLTREGPIVTEEHIEDLVRIGTKEGSLEPDKQEMLSGVFELSDTPARAIMVPRTAIVGLPIDAKLDAVLSIATSEKYSRYPVWEGSPDNVRGIFYGRELLEWMQTGRKEAFVLARHLHRAIYVPEARKASELLRDFQREKVHMAIVVDEFGGTAGIVTLEDVIEELVGEIYDETDEPEKHLLRLAEGRWAVDARTPLRDFSEQVGFTLPDDGGYDTVGGFIVSHVGHVPVRGERVPWQRLLFVVQDADKTRVKRLELTVFDEGGVAPQEAEEPNALA